MNKLFTLKEFQLRFQNEADCYGYLIDQKWRESYNCRRCGCMQYVQGEKKL